MPDGTARHNDRSGASYTSPTRRKKRRRRARERQESHIAARRAPGPQSAASVREGKDSSHSRPPRLSCPGAWPGRQPLSSRVCLGESRQPPWPRGAHLQSRQIRGGSARRALSPASGGRKCPRVSLRSPSGTRSCRNDPDLSCLPYPATPCLWPVKRLQTGEQSLDGARLPFCCLSCPPAPVREHAWPGVLEAETTQSTGAPARPPAHRPAERGIHRHARLPPALTGNGERCLF